MRALILFILCVIPVSTWAAENTPLEITADTALEWNQKNKTYVARGNALAKQGDLSVTADTLTATYAGQDGSSSDIILLEANGKVTLTSGDNIAIGDKVVYDLTTGKAILSGTRPKITQGTKNTLEADEILVWTKKSDNSPSDGTLDHAEAIGNVVITSGQQVATGNKATYQADTNMAELIGNVQVKQGDNWLQGNRAEMNMTTQVSKMFGDKTSKGRVKGVFHTGSGKKE